MKNEWRVKVGEAETSAVFEPADGKERAVFVCAHGAGGNMNDSSWDTMSNSFSQMMSGPVLVSFTNRATFSLFQRLDSNYVAGRFVWFLLFASATPSSGDVPIAVSPAFAIT